MRLILLALGLFTPVVTACSDPNALQPATSANRVDTVDVFSLSGTPVWEPSAYATLERRAVRLDQTNAADFAYEMMTSGRRAFLPGALVGTPGSAGVDPGFLRTTLPFDSITVAELNGYVTRDTVDIAQGDVFYVRGRISAICFLGLPTYGKLEVLSFDDDVRTVRFQVLVNTNCGYKSLEPGLPKH